MTRCYRIIVYTPYPGEEFTGYCCITEDDEERLHSFAELLVAENADEYIAKHVADITDEEECEQFYKGCGARFQEIDYDTYEEEAFEDYGEEEAWV